MVETLKLSPSQSRSLEEIRARLRSVEESGYAVVEFVVAQMRAMLGVDAAGAYALEDSVAGPRLAFGMWTGLPIAPSRVNQCVSDSLERLGPFAAYDPLRPSPRQRNRLLVFPSTRRLETATEINVRALKALERQEALSRIQQHHEMFVRIGVQDLQHQRVLICDGPRLLAWFGALTHDDCTPQRRRLLEILASLLRPRLRLERERKHAGVAYAALDAALEAIGAPALVLTGDGAVVHANAVGQELFDRDRQQIADLLSRVRHGAVDDVDSYDLGSRGQPGAQLVVLRSRGQLAAMRHRAAATTWKLTPREAEVLEGVIAGDINRDIATTLNCAEATIEIHVSRLLRKARASTRAALVSAYWTLGTPV